MMIKKALTLILALSISTLIVAQSVGETVQSRQNEIANISQSINGGLLDKAKARDRLRELRNLARAETERLGKLKTEKEEQLKSLGEPPENEAVEDSEVGERRAELNSAIANISAGLSQARLNADDTSRLLAEISEDTREAFREKLLKKEKSLLNSNRWIDTTHTLSKSSKSTTVFITNWYAKSKTDGKFNEYLASIIGIIALFLILYWPVRKKINQSLKQKLKSHEYSDASRYHSMLIALVTRFIGILVTGYLLLLVVSSTGLITEVWYKRFSLIWYALLGWLLVDGLLLAIFTPKASTKRLFPIADDLAQRAYWLCLLAATIILVSHTSSLILEESMVPSGLNQVISITSSLLISVLLIISSRDVIGNITERKGEHTSDERALENNVSRFYIKIWKSLKLAAFPISLFILGALLFGYLNLAQFISNRAVLIVIFVLFFWYFRDLLMLGITKIESLLPKNHDEENTNNIALKKEPQSVNFWAGVAVDFSLLVAIAPLALLLIGLDYSEVKVRIIDAYNGFTIGNITISLADIFTALLTFFVIITVTRFLQKILDARLFNRTGADAGFRNTFRTLLGYAGMLLAIFVSIGVVGLDLSNLAIIAGALSVGIGFGLQSIVNNFVSGLILLFERPVKVGDWVVTASGEGFIKRISVRSTEIETFNMASVIIPNSELISSSVQNWTHKDSGGRVVIPVGVSYGSDMDLVRNILLQCVSEHKDILKYPAPSVYFKDFGSSSLDVELRFFVRNIPDGIHIRSDMRFKILSAFRKNKIEIPFPQTDLNMKTPVTLADTSLGNDDKTFNDQSLEESGS